MPATQQRWGGRSHPGDLTGTRGRQLVAERDARTKQTEAAKRMEDERATYRSPSELVDEVQATLKTGSAYWNPDTGQVEVSYVSGR